MLTVISALIAIFKLLTSFVLYLKDKQLLDAGKKAELAELFTKAAEGLMLANKARDEAAKQFDVAPYEDDGYKRD
jgi:hypothetical protein